MQVYMPTINSSDEEMEDVYENIDKLIENVKREENLILMEDWKCRGGRRKSKQYIW